MGFRLLIVKIASSEYELEPPVLTSWPPLPLLIDVFDPVVTLRNFKLPSYDVFAVHYGCKGDNAKSV